MYDHGHCLLHAAIIVGLSSLTYQATEGPGAVASVCASIEVAVRPLRRDTSVYLFTPVTGATVTGNFSMCSFPDFLEGVDKLLFLDQTSLKI